MKGLVFFAFFPLCLGLTSCGSTTNTVDGALAGEEVSSTEFQDTRVPGGPQPLVPVYADNDSSQKITPRQFLVDSKTGEVKLSADLENDQHLDFKGDLNRDTGLARLISNDKNTQAFAACLDEGICNQFVVTVFKKEGDKITHTQYVTPPKVNQPVENPSTENPVAPPADDGGTQEQPAEVEHDSGEDTAGEFVTPPADFENTQKPVSPLPKIAEAYGPHFTERINGVSVQGRLVRGKELPQAGPGFVRKASRPGIPGYWGAENMISLLMRVAYNMTLAFPQSSPLLIGDIARQHGQFFQGHDAHQNGLDADIAYPLKRESSESHFVNILSGSGVSDELDVTRLWFLHKNYVQLENVPSIFVDQHVKQAECNFARSIGEYSDQPGNVFYETLLRLTPLTGHENHYHVRLQCSPQMVHCQKVCPGWMDCKTGAPKQNITNGCS